MTTLTRFLKLAIVAATCAVVSVHASPLMKVCASAGGCGFANVVSDNRLADIAGKFSVSGDVVGMRLSMLSSWQSSGQTLHASASWSMDLPTNGRAGMFSTQATAGGDDAGGAATDSALTRGANEHAGVKNINGVSQVIQVAGDGNGAINRAAVSVSTDNLNAFEEGHSATAAYTSADGSEAKVAVNAASVVVQLKMAHGAGTASQDINLIKNSIRQNIQISAAQQNVTNEMRLQLQIRPMTNLGLAEQGFAQAVGALRGR